MWPALVDLAKHEVSDFSTLQLRAFGMFFGLCIVEALLSRPRPPAKPTPDLVADMFYWLLSPTIRVISRLLLAVLMVAIALGVGLRASPALFDGFGPLARQPLWLAMIELLLLMDLSSYWSHRLFHTVPFLWRFHAIHHSAKNVRWATTARVHPVNEIATYLVSTVPFFLVGFPVRAVFPLLPGVMVIALCAHTQWNLSFGPLGQVFVSPRFHRWHHTHTDEGGNSNYSNVFSFWDRLFGTRYYPEDRVAETLGLDVDDVPESYLGQLLYPFGRTRAVGASLSDATQPALPRPPGATPTPLPARDRGVPLPMSKG